MSARLVATLLLCALAPLAPLPARAQSLTPTRPYLAWETIETPHFAFHYPREMREWTASVARRMEAQRAAVSALVGYTPPARVQVVVDDPYNSANGSAYPIVGAPAIILWPVPPAPTSEIGDSRSWEEGLTVHEFAHVAHLVRPSRNPRQRLLWRLLPRDVGPIAREGSRWVWEGYATYVEGEITGSGRPHGAARAALLRQWAIEGVLPSYAQLDATGGYRTGSYAYQVGSAYLEWLVGRGGDSSLVHVWRRLTARQVRSFDEAFAGVYGAPPAELYGRFRAELTGKALRARDRIAERGIAPGELVQKLSYYVGDPALSRDGKLVALTLHYQDRPGRLVVWAADTAAETAAARRARLRAAERARALDPEDVPAVHPYPPPRREVAVLESSTGRTFTEPRFLADGRTLLVSRSDPTGDGSLRPDLYLWDYKSRRLRRVTHGAAVRYADPAPDGRTAVGVRCLRGFCDLVRLDLATGRVETVAAGTSSRSYYRPRFSPDGRSVAFTVQDERGVWRLGVMLASGSDARLVGPDDAVNRYGASFTADGTALVYVSEAGGVANIERLDLATGETRPLTRVTGAAFPPATSASGDATFYLSEHARGLDLYRVHADSVLPGGVVALDTSLAPAAPVPPAPRDTFPASPTAAPRPYGAGPRQYVWLPGGAYATEGRFATLTITSLDPAGRLAWTATGALGDRGTWRGGALDAEWRGFRPVLRASAFYAEQEPSRQRAGSFASPALDARYAGGALGASLLRDFGSRQARYAVGASLGALGARGARAVPRSVAFAEYGGLLGGFRGERYASAALSLHGAAGSTDHAGWERALTSATLTAGSGETAIRGSVAYGAVSREAPAWERFTVGGVRSPLVDAALLSQRVALPAAPVGVRSGRELYAYRVALSRGGLVQPYLAGVSTRGGFADAFRSLGVDVGGSLGDTPVLSLPGVRAQAGVAYMLDEPFRKKTRGYLSIEYRP